VVERLKEGGNSKHPQLNLRHPVFKPLGPRKKGHRRRGSEITFSHEEKKRGKKADSQSRAALTRKQNERQRVKGRKRKKGLQGRVRGSDHCMYDKKHSQARYRHRRRSTVTGYEKKKVNWKKSKSNYCWWETQKKENWGQLIPTNSVLVSGIGFAKLGEKKIRGLAERSGNSMFVPHQKAKRNCTGLRVGR